MKAMHMFHAYGKFVLAIEIKSLAALRCPQGTTFVQADGEGKLVIQRLRGLA